MPGATGSRFVATGSLPLQSASSINSAVPKSSGLTPGADATLAAITVDAAATIPLTISSGTLVLVQAAAVNVITLTISSAAVALVQAAAAGILVLVGNDDARVLVQATEVGSIALVGASTAVAAVQAAAALVLTLAGSATAVAAVAGQSASTIALVGSSAANIPVAAGAQLVLPLVGTSDASVGDVAAAPTPNRGGGSGRARYAGAERYFNPRAAASSRPFPSPRYVPISVDAAGVLELRVESHAVAEVAAGAASQLALTVSAGATTDDPFFRAVALFLLDEAA
jgi:hypothetical protein